MPRAPPVTIAVLPSSMPILSSSSSSRSRASRPTACAGDEYQPNPHLESRNRKPEGTMRAVGYKHALPIDQAESLIDIEIAKPSPVGRDLLVQVKAVSVNPVDTKVRMRADPKGGEPKILGFDATGVVAA